MAAHTYPWKFMFVTTMNPCPCGYHHDQDRACVCTPMQVQRYRDKMSGPLLDRIDLHIDMPAVRFRDLQSVAEETSETVRNRVLNAMEIQISRFKERPVNSNGQMRLSELKIFCRLDKESKLLLEKAFKKLSMSARAYHRILRVARTIADLAGEESIALPHLSEAIGYRTLDRGWWDRSIPGLP